MLQTDTRVGLTEQEVVARRKKYGLNQMKEEKESKFHTSVWQMSHPDWQRVISEHHYRAIGNALWSRDCDQACHSDRLSLDMITDRYLSQT